MRKMWVAAVLVLAGCGGKDATAVDSTDFVCDDFAEFARDGRPADQRSEVISGIGDLIGNANPSLQDAYSTLTNTVNGTPGARQIADDTFAQACFDAGWAG